MNNYPPGVTGHEYTIAGPDTEEEIDGECPNGHQHLFRLTYAGEAWIACGLCDYQRDEDTGRDPWDEADERYQRMKEEGF